MTTTFTQFIAMGGYGFFVWCAYGFAAVMLGLNVFLAVKQWNKIKKNIKP